MKLFTSPTTPFGRKIAVLLTEKALLDRVAIQMVTGTPVEPGTMPIAHNPLGKIPVLVLGDGTALHDSRVISRFLDDHFALDLYPKGAALWPALAREAAIDGMIEAAVLMVYESRLRPEELRFAPWIDAQQRKITRTLDMFEATPPQGALAMEQIALACALGYLDFRHAVLDWRAGRPKLTAFLDEMAKHASFIETTPPS
jgi:glutathione S-transferase